MNAPLLQVDALSVCFPARGAVGESRLLHAVDDVSFALEAGQTLGIVGESGCGKSTLARAILRLTPVSSGTLRFDGRDYTHEHQKSLRPLRRAMRIVFQDPLASLNPRFSVAAAVREPLDIFEPGRPRAERDHEVAAMLERVGLGSEFHDRYPHELSGGQNQRVSIARALIGGPRLVICDESVSALDVSIQAQILNLLVDIQRDTGIALLFISHDLSVVRHISRDLLVLYLGRTMEYGPSEQVFREPRHPYTRALIDAVPTMDPHRERERSRLAAAPAGEMPSPLAPPSGCVYRTRCTGSTELCAIKRPALLTPENGRQVACHHSL